MPSTSDAAFGLRSVKKAHTEVLNVLSIPEIQKQLTDDQREELMKAERILWVLRAEFAEAVGNELRNAGITIR